eukprot:gnl/TRDRNA2_/TRDRNA2_176670_c2_seq7.p1 gnl/TRDRNA2_/TRDRNA2_176670_c2~~gnl/TRDRNA2_/TRDRNA2_176670_c2_seq7.p1  ORF type:complete len:233 (-),score=23.23 gnl/TRDRNA2_/TRDRNA2_176670_c2_seq7:274-972(-)
MSIVRPIRMVPCGGQLLLLLAFCGTDELASALPLMHDSPLPMGGHPSGAPTPKEASGSDAVSLFRMSSINRVVQQGNASSTSQEIDRGNRHRKMGCTWSADRQQVWSCAAEGDSTTGKECQAKRQTSKWNRKIELTRIKVTNVRILIETANTIRVLLWRDFDDKHSSWDDRKNVELQADWRLWDKKWTAFSAEKCERAPDKDHGIETLEFEDDQQFRGFVEAIQYGIDNFRR